MKAFNIAEAKAHFSQLVRQAMAGEEIVISKDNQPLLRLVPITSGPGKRQPGAGKSQFFYMAPDFDAPLEEFADYMKE